MSLVTITGDELKRMDRTIREQKKIIRDQQAILERVVVLLQPLIDAGKEQ